MAPPLHRHPRTVDAPLEQRPEVLQRVRVDHAVHVTDGVVDGLVCVVTLQAMVARQVVAVERQPAATVSLTSRCSVVRLRSSTTFVLTMPPRSSMPRTMVLSVGPRPLIRRAFTSLFLSAHFRIALEPVVDRLCGWIHYGRARPGRGCAAGGRLHLRQPAPEHPK